MMAKKAMNNEKLRVRDRGGEALKRLKANPATAEEIDVLSKEWMLLDQKHLESFPAIRKAAQLTQVEVADRLGIAQAGVSRLESQKDMLLSTLGKYLSAVGSNPRLVVTINSEDYVVDLGLLAAGV